MDTKLLLELVSCDVEEDNFKHGVTGDDITNIVADSKGKLFDTMPELLDYVRETYAIKLDQFTGFEDGRLSYTTLHDVENSEVDPTDPIYREFKKGKAKLWHAAWDIYFSEITSHKPKPEEMKERYGITPY